MPHISSKELDSVTFGKIFSKLVSVLERAQDRRKLSLVLGELLTDTEKIMLAKRLAAALLLAKGMPQHRISEVLIMSPSTVSKMSLKVETGLYDSILKFSEREKVDLERMVWLLLTAGGIMPPRVGGKNWRKKGYKTLL